MNFETRVRVYIRELIEPMVHKSKVDREMIFKIQKSDENVADRLGLLEQAVYQRDTETGKTLFDQMEEKILEMDILLKTSIRDLNDRVDNAKELLE